MPRAAGSAGRSPGQATWPACAGRRTHPEIAAAIVRETEGRCREQRLVAETTGRQTRARGPDERIRHGRRRSTGNPKRGGLTERGIATGNSPAGASRGVAAQLRLFCARCCPCHSALVEDCSGRANDAARIAATRSAAVHSRAPRDRRSVRRALARRRNRNALDMLRARSHQLASGAPPVASSPNTARRLPDPHTPRRSASAAASVPAAPVRLPCVARAVPRPAS